MSYPSNSSRAIVIGSLLVLVGLVLVVVAAGATDDARTFVIGGLVAVGGVLRLTTALAMDARSRRDRDPDDPRWHDGTGFVQLAGRACVECGQKITVATEACSCAVCSAPAHLDCQELHDAHAHRSAVAFPLV